MEQVKEKDNKPVRFGADGRPEGNDVALTSLLFKGLESSIPFPPTTPGSSLVIEF